AVAARVVLLHVLGGIVVERPPGLRIEAGGPVELVDVLLAGDERAGHAVEHIIEPVAAGVDDKLGGLANNPGVHERVPGGFGEVVRVVGGGLVAPFDLAVGRVEREHARRPPVVAGPVFGIEVRPGIADALIERVGVWIVGRGLPHRAAAVLPALLVILPGLV